MARKVAPISHIIHIKYEQALGLQMGAELGGDFQLELMI